MTDLINLTEINLTYVGRRLGLKDKLYEGWQAADADLPRFYDKFRPTIVVLAPPSPSMKPQKVRS